MNKEFLEKLKLLGLIVNYTVQTNGDFYIQPVKPVENIRINIGVEKDDSPK